jgi:sporulation protein YlmC with PRC-barrel domain
MPPTHAKHLVADILDQQIVDAKKTKLGKIDGLVIVLREGKPPRVAYIECGAPVWARRLGRWCERLALALNRRFGVREKPRYRIPWSKVKSIGIDVVVDVDEHPLLAWEEWLSEHVVGRIPFSK